MANPKLQWSVLHWVEQDSTENYYSVAQAILDAGADPDAYDHVGVTPLYLACVHGQAEVAAFLIRNGADGLRPTAGLLCPIHLMLNSAFNVPKELALLSLRQRMKQQA